MKRFDRRLLAALAAACAFSGAWAQTPPDAGAILRDIEQQRPRTPEVPLGPPPSLSIEKPAVSSSAPRDNVKMRLNGVRVTGTTVFPASLLEALVDAGLHGDVTLGDADRAAEQITAYYRERGYILANAYVPPQEIADGRVQIAVVEGRYGSVQLANQSSARTATLADYVSRERIGHVVNEESLNRALLLLRDLVHGLPVTASLRPGVEAGTSDLTIFVSGEPQVQARVEADNFGSRSTGRVRFGAAAQVNELIGIGDQVEIRGLTTARGQNYLRVGWSAPLNGSGLRLETALAHSIYHLGGDFAALDASGTADSVSAGLTYPLLRGLGLNVNLLGSVEHKALKDSVGLLGSTARKSSTLLSLAVNAERLGDSGDATSGSLRLDNGHLNLRDPASEATDAASLQTRGGFSKLGYSATHGMPIGQSLVLQGSLSGQSASKNLDSSEKFSLGGPFGVRAYPVGEASGDSGWVASLELRYLTSSWIDGVGLSLFGFLDYGSAKLNEDPITAARNRRNLSGTGVGVSLARSGDYSARLMYAHRLGNEPAISDQRNGRGRVWLQASKSF